MKRFIPIAVILFVILFFFRNFFLHQLLPIPSDALVGLYNPFRDVYAKEFSRGIPFKNFLITDPIRQQYAWRELAISIEKNMTLPLWNPYSFSGYPLLANFQTSAFYPLNVFFFILPFWFGWSVLIILQPLFAGVFLFLYLRNLKLHPLAAILGAIAFAFSGFSVAWLEWNIMVQTLMWVPLILLAKDKLLEKWTIRWTLALLFAEVSLFLAGHLQIWFYAFCVTNVYLFARIYQKIKLQKTKNFFLQYQRNYFPYFLVGIVFFVVTAIQWLSTLQFIFLSARGVDQSYLEAGWFIPWQHLVQFIFPDFFGNPTTLNYWGVWNYGELVGYIGIFPLFLAFLAGFFRHDKKTYFWTTLCIVALLFSLPTPLAKLPFILHIPLLSTSQPTRLVGVIDMSLAILAALGMDLMIRQKSIRLNLSIILACFSAIFIGVWIFVFRFHSFAFSPENFSIAVHNMIFPTTVFVSIAVILALFIIFQKQIPRRVQLLIFSVLLFITIADLLRFADKFTPFTPKEYVYPTTKAITFLQNNIDNFRFMTTDSQILPPNVSSVYRLQSIEGYDPLYIDRYAAFISAISRKGPDISSPYGFNRIIVPHDFDSPLINLLGVKYILTFNEITNNGYKKVFEEGKTMVYENQHAIPRAFFVEDVISAKNKQDSINKVFQNSQELGSVAIVEDSLQNKVFSKGQVQVVQYSESKIVLQAKNSGDGFLVLTDVYYPTWHATIDGKEQKIYITDFTLRGISVPKGEHTIVFEDKLF